MNVQASKELSIVILFCLQELSTQSLHKIYLYPSNSL